MLLQSLLFDGNASNNQIVTPITNYLPVVIGGTLNQNGAVGNGDINLSSNTQAKGGDFSMSIPMMPFLMNLDTNVDSYRVYDGGNAVFDFRTGDPLAATKINDLSKQAGGQIVFVGTNTDQEHGVVDRFQTGSQNRVDSAFAALQKDKKNFNGLNAANNDHASTLGDRQAVLDRKTKENEARRAANEAKRNSRQRLQILLI